MADAFYGASNMRMSATDKPNLSAFSSGAFNSLASMFTAATAFNGDISGWNVANVTSVNAMFDNATAFNQNLGRWYIVPSNTDTDNAVALTIIVSNVTGTNTVTSIIKADSSVTLDVDNSGGFDINDALMIVRYALSIKGANLTDATPMFVVTNIERLEP